MQVWLTKDGIYHEEQFPPIKRRRNKHETREERKQRKYRYLYQVSLFSIFVQNNEFLVYILFLGENLPWRRDLTTYLKQICHTN